jgi:hypothetical protein
MNQSRKVRFEDLFARSVRVATHVDRLLAGEANPIPQVGPDGGVKNQPLTVRPHLSYVLGIYARTRSYFQATLLLIRNGFSDEALTVGRSLFEDSLRLGIVANTEDEVRQIDGLIGWLLDGVTRATGLYSEARILGVGHSHDEVITALEGERDKMIRYRERNGSGRKISPIFAEQELKKVALGQDRSDSWWLHELADHMVHGNYFAHVLRQEKSADGDIALIAVRNPKPQALIDVVAFATESMVLSHRSICAIFELHDMPELDKLLDDLEQLQEQAGGSTV